MAVTTISGRRAPLRRPGLGMLLLGLGMGLGLGAAMLAGPAGAAEPAGAPAAADLARAEAIVKERCHLCHGLQGESASAVFPRLAGQHAQYIAKQLGDFQSGQRKSETMKPQAAPLTPAEMQALGAYFASRKVPGRAARYSS